MSQSRREVTSRAEAKALRERTRRQAKDTARRAEVESRAQARTPAAVRHVRWSLAHAVAVLAVLAAGLFAAHVLLASEAVLAMPAEGRAVTRGVILAVFYGIQIGVLLFLARRMGSTLAKSFSLARLGGTWRERLVGTLWVLAMVVLTRAASTVWTAATHAWGWSPADDTPLVSVFGSGPAGIALSIVILVLAGPVTEELVYRGVVLEALGDRWGRSVAIVGSAALFALSHASLWAIVPMFALGCALAWLAWERRTLWPSIALHVVYNGLVVGAAYWLARV